MGRLLKRIAVGLLALLGVALVAVYLISLRASPLVNELLRDWATGEVVRQSDSVYALHVGRLHFNWPRRRVTLDSALVLTDSTRNAQRTWPKPTVNGVLRSCVISGVNLPRLVFGRGLEASQIGCAEVHWESDAPPDSASVAHFQQARTRAPRPKPPPADAQRTLGAPHGAVMSFQRDLHLPRRVPTIRIGRIVRVRRSFPCRSRTSSPAADSARSTTGTPTSRCRVS
jgi:hypothetical protein